MSDATQQDIGAQSIALLADLTDRGGDAILDAVDVFLSRFIAYPNEHARHAHTLWLAHTWRMDEWDSTPRLAFMSPEKGSGKTRALEVSQYLVPHGVRVAQASTAYVLARISDDPPPTLFYDEIDTVYGSRARGNEDLRAVLNAGHRRGATAGRASWGEDGLTGQDYAAYCAVALAGLGSLPETIADRAVIIRMKKRRADEPISPWRERVNAKEAKAIGERLGKWMASAPMCWPTQMPVEDRAGDVWEALVMVADAAGGRWPSNARTAAIVLTSGDEQASVGIQLLGDIRTVFGTKAKIRSVDICSALSKIEGAPWAAYHRDGRSIDPTDLYRLLRTYGIWSKDVWVENKSAKGYVADDLSDAWTRYLPR